MTTTPCHPAPAPGPAYWGVNHAKMTAAMETALEDHPLAFLRLARLRRLVGDGNTTPPLQGIRGVAGYLKIARGWVRPFLTLLADHGFIAWTVDSQRRYRITVLPAPELVARDAAARSAGDDPAEPREPAIMPVLMPAPPAARSAADQPVEPPEPPVVTPEPPAAARSTSDRMNHESCTMQQQQHAAPPNDLQRSDPPPAPPASLPLPALLAAAPPQPAPAPDHPEVIFGAALQRIRQHNPDYTDQDFRRDYANAQTRTDIRVSPLALVVYCAQRCEPVYSQDAYRRSSRSAPPPGAPAAHPPRRRATAPPPDPAPLPDYLRTLDLRLSPEEQAALAAELARAAGAGP